MAEGDEERASYPCPACGSSLYGWVRISSPDRPQPILDRCESCGLAVRREDGPVDVRAELAAISRGPGEYAAANRRSLQASLGEGHWAGLDPNRRIHLTPRAAVLLFEQQGLEIGSVAFPRLGRNLGWMWQTLMNALTLRDNFARDAREGLIRPERPKARLAFAIDAMVTLVAALPVTFFTVVLEPLAAALRRGGEIVIEARPVATTPEDELDDADELAAG